jgi:hypothetical protein
MLLYNDLQHIELNKPLDQLNTWMMQLMMQLNNTVNGNAQPTDNDANNA